MFTAGLAAFSAGIITLSLMSASPPGIATQPAMQRLESQLLVQLEAPDRAASSGSPADTCNF
jgi:hypothetical protein